MTDVRFGFPNLVSLLRRSEADAYVINFFGQATMRNIERDEHYGSLEFKADGLDVVFKKAPWVVPAEHATNLEELYVSAFHLRKQGHDGFAQYSLAFPNGVQLGDTETALARKLGQPSIVGGGGASSPVLRRPLPKWARYDLAQYSLHFQFDTEKLIDMVTILVPDILF